MNRKMHTSDDLEDWVRWSLSPISLVDCLVFCFFLAAALIKQIGLPQTIWAVLWTLPFFRKFESGLRNEADQSSG